jgi:hypothetical protein
MRGTAIPLTSRVEGYAVKTLAPPHVGAGGEHSTFEPGLAGCNAAKKVIADRADRQCRAAVARDEPVLQAQAAESPPTLDHKRCGHECEGDDRRERAHMVPGGPRSGVLAPQVGRAGGGG